MFTLAPKGYVATSSLTNALVTSEKPGVIAAVAGQIDGSAPSGTYYVQLIDSATAVNAGGAITLIAVKEVNHKQNEAELFDFEFGLGGVRCANGCVVQLSTTVGTGTLDGSIMLAFAAYLV